MKYCRTTTENHAIALSHKCLKSINHLIVSEGYIGQDSLFENDEVVLDMDYAEAIIAAKENRLKKNKSMDLAFGIRNIESTKIKMLMVELRLNYNNPNNLNRQEIEEKVAGTRENLSHYPPIYNQYIFVFKTEQLQEAINRLFRMIPRIQSNYVVMDIYQLKDKFF